MSRALSTFVWVAIALVGAAAFGVLALSRGETISAGWLIVAGVCSYLVAYRFYSRYLAYTVFGLDDRRATPAERLNNGRDFVPTNKWVAARASLLRDFRRRTAGRARRSRRSSASCPARSG